VTDAPATNLDAFEAALLSELRTTVAESATPALAVLPEPTRTQGRRPWSVAALGAAAAALAVALVVPSLRPTPAYAVSARDNGEVTVQVNRLEGADGLEQALRERGIAADVTYLPEGQKCAAGRYAAVPTTGLTLSVSSATFEVTIPANAVSAEDTFVLSAAVVPLSDGGVQAIVDFDIASGAIAPCRRVDAS